ncbi:MAG: hypothetical protein WCY53_06095, partial [Sphaerochaetaceae bacterium]
MRISNSVEKDDVGWVDLIAIHSDTIYAMTQYKGFASYDGNWKKIDISTKKIGNYTYNSTANKIFFITNDGANTFIYDLDSTTSSPSVIDLADKEILSSSRYNFVLVKED